MIIVSAAMVVCGGCINETGEKTQSYEIVWAGTPPEGHSAIEAKLSRQIAPYEGVVYDNVTVSAMKKDGVTHLHATATSPACIYPDRYEFIYNDHLVRTGYLLEAIPESIRQDAIGIAMQDPEIAGVLSGDAGTPTVRRILPETAEKFYTAKTCLSVTWADASASALIDMDSRSVVGTWGAGG